MALYGDVVAITNPSSTFYGRRGIVVDVHRPAILVRLTFRRGKYGITTLDTPFTEQDIQIRIGERIDVLPDE